MNIKKLVSNPVNLLLVTAIFTSAVIYLSGPPTILTETTTDSGMPCVESSKGGLTCDFGYADRGREVSMLVPDYSDMFTVDCNAGGDDALFCYTVKVTDGDP